MILRDYQIELSNKATQILKDYGLVYLAMQVRTGKTLTAFATAHKIGAKKVLFVTKKKAIDDIIAQGVELGLKLEIYVTNYEQLHNVGTEFDLVIIDEAQSIGAFPTPSLRAKELKRICNDKPIIYLSGTPTPESFSQLFYQMWVSSFSPFKDHKNFYHWARVYVDIRKKYLYGKQINDYSYAKRELIEEKTNHLFVAFTQEQAGFTELVKENVLYVKMEENTYKFAERLRIDKVITNKEGRTVLGDTAVKLMNKLHQIYSGSVIIDAPIRDAKVFDYTKAEFIKEYFKGKKIAIFYKFAAERMALKWKMGKCYEDPTEFNNNNDGCFISQIVSGREGVNLSTADALVFYNIDFSATSYWQSRARIQTKDRVKEAQIYWIFSEGGIEDKIYKAVMDKRDYTTEYFKKDYGISK
jgi:SNF2 family DNA or RNA helicase